MSTGTRKYIWEVFFLRSWWVYIFCFICFLSYNHAIMVRTKEVGVLHKRFLQLEKDRDIARKNRQDLHMQIYSQSDPSWIELVLMKQLGVVPEGYLKIHFKQE